MAGSRLNVVRGLPMSSESLWRGSFSFRSHHRELSRVEPVGPEAEERVDEGDQDGGPGEARSHEQPAAGQQDEAVVEARIHEMMMERGVPECQEHEDLDGEEIEPVGDDGQLLEGVMAEKGRREREQTDEEEEGVVEPNERPIRAFHDLESNMMTDPEDPDRDEAQRIGQDSCHDVLEGRELLVCGACDVRDGQAESKDRHDGSKDSVREGLDPGLPESGDGASTCAHGPAALSSE